MGISLDWMYRRLNGIRDSLIEKKDIAYKLKQHIDCCAWQNQLLFIRFAIGLFVLVENISSRVLLLTTEPISSKQQQNRKKKQIQQYQQQKRSVT